MTFWTIAASIGAAGVALLALGWAVTRYLVERPSHEVSEMQRAMNLAKEAGDPLEHLYRALACERLARRYIPSRRSFWLLGCLWLWATLIVSPFAAKDIALHFQANIPVWVSLSVYMVIIIPSTYLAGYFSSQLVRNVSWGTEALHLRLGDLTVASRQAFLEGVEEIPEHEGPGTLRAFLDSGLKERRWDRARYQTRRKQRG